MRTHPEQGFTLIELMIVVALIGVIAGLAGPSFNRSVRRSRINEMGRTLHAAYLEAQSLAMRTGFEHCLRLDRVGRGWSIRKDSNQDPSDDCEAPVSSYTLAHASVALGPEAGIATAFPDPYGGVPVDSWCTPCGGDDVGILWFKTDGTLRLDALGGSVALHDADGTVPTVERLMFISATGAARLVRNN